MSYELIPSEQFEKDVKQLKKRFKNLKADLEALENLLMESPTSGTPMGRHCYKIRIPNSSIPTGKQGGFRIITHVLVEKERIYLLTIYSKTEQDDVPDAKIQSILEQLKRS